MFKILFNLLIETNQLLNPSDFVNNPDNLSQISLGNVGGDAEVNIIESQNYEPNKQPPRIIVNIDDSEQSNSPKKPAKL